MHPDYFSQANDNTGVIVQIETAESLANARNIIATPGLSAVFFGPADMAASLGHLGNSGHPDVQGAAETILRICKEKGVPCGTLTNSFENAQKRLDQGFNFVFPDYDENIRHRAIEETAIRFLGYMPK